MSSNDDSEPDVRARIGNAASIFHGLRHIVINYHQLYTLHRHTAIVIPTAMYACETWTGTVMIAHRLDVFHRRCLRTILGISWKWLATSSDCREKDPPIQQCTGCQKTTEERGGGQRRHGEAPSKQTWKKWVSAGIESAGSAVTVRDGDLSSPDAPRGTGGPKSKCNASQNYWKVNTFYVYCVILQCIDIRP